MSEVLRARMRECLTAYQVGCGTLLDVDELAAELLESVLPGNDNDCMDEPLFRALICEWGVCTNCYGGDCVLPGLRRHRRRPHRLTRMPGVRVSRPGERHELWWTAQ